MVTFMEKLLQYFQSKLNSTADSKNLYLDIKFGDRGNTRESYKNVQDKVNDKKTLGYILGQDKYTDSLWYLLFVSSIFKNKVLDIPGLVSCM